MKVELSVELDSEDLKKNKRLSEHVIKLLAKQAKEKPKKLIEDMPEDDEAD